MTREQKVQKRINRANARRLKRSLVQDQISSVMHFDHVSRGCARSKVVHGYFKPWSDSSSPTGMMQVCSYQGHCQYPCNGDC